MSIWKVKWYAALAVVICLAGSAVAQEFPEIAIDLNPDTPEIDSTITVTAGVVNHGVVRLLSWPAAEPNGGFNGYNLKILASPCSLTDAYTQAGDHMLDSSAGAELSDPVNCTIGRNLLVPVALYVSPPAIVFHFYYAVSESVDLTFRADGPDFGLITLGTTYLLQAGQVVYNSATANTGEVPTDTPTPFIPPTPTDTPSIPTPETTFTPTPTEVPTDTPTEIPTPTPTETAFAPFALLAVDCYAGMHPAPGVSVDIGCFQDYFYPLHVIRDADLTGDNEGVFVVDLFGHIFSYTIGESCVPQIETQFNFYPDDLCLAVAASETSFGAHILIDNGDILPVGDVNDIPNVDPPLPYRNVGTAETLEAEFPGPKIGPLAVGTISMTGGWNEESAIDFDLVGADGAIVLARNGRVHKVGSAAAIDFGSHSPWLWPDLARRIEYLNVGGQDYYVVLDGLGGVHMAGPDGALKTSFQTRVLDGSLTYFAAISGGQYVGIDAANDFVPVIHSGDTEIGIIMLDGLGGLHMANIPYTMAPTAYLPDADQFLNTMISLLAVPVAAP